MNGHKRHPVRRSGQPFIEAAAKKMKLRSSSAFEHNFSLTFLVLLFIVLAHHFLPSLYFILVLRIIY